MSEHPDELVELVAAAIFEYDSSANHHRNLVRAILDALAAAGRLVPEGSMVVTEYGRRCEHSDFWAASSSSVYPRTDHATPIRRTVITTPIEVVE